VPSQRMSDVKSGATVRQQSNISVDQVLERIDAVGDVEQLIEVATSNLDAAAKQLAKLRAEIQKYDPKATAELDRLAAAETAAKSGDGAGVIANLKGLGKWVSDFASKIGAAIVARLIEKQMGL
jgi:flagellar motility protein MotE (MotC chaperone)